MTVTETSTLGIKKISVKGLRKSILLLGGTVIRQTPHNYDIYEMPGSDRQVHAPNPSGRGSGEVGMGALVGVVASLKEAGVYDVFIAQAFQHNGAAFHPGQEPERAGWIVPLLREHRDEVQAGSWRRLLDRAYAHVRTEAEKKHGVSAMTKPEPSPEIAYVTNLTLPDAVRMGLPDDFDPKVADSATRSISRRIGRPSEEPFRSLVERGEIVREKATRGGGFDYHMTNDAALAIAHQAKVYYDERVAPGEGPEVAEPEVAAMEAPSLEAPSLEAPSPEAADPPDALAHALLSSSRDAQRGEPESWGEALFRLCERFGVYPEFTQRGEEMVLRMEKLVRNLEEASRDI